RCLDFTGISRRLPCDGESSEAQCVLDVALARDILRSGELSMPPDLAAEIAALPRLRVSELRVKFAAVFGEPTPSHNKVWLIKRIAWRLQAQAEGDLSERARRRAAELIADADLRLSAPLADAT